MLLKKGLLSTLSIALILGFPPKLPMQTPINATIRELKPNMANCIPLAKITSTAALHGTNTKATVPN